MKNTLEIILYQTHSVQMFNKGKKYTRDYSLSDALSAEGQLLGVGAMFVFYMDAGGMMNCAIVCPLSLVILSISAAVTGNLTLYLAYSLRLLS